MTFTKLIIHFFHCNSPMSRASLHQLWNIQTALLMVFQQITTWTCLFIKAAQRSLRMRIFCEHKIVLFDVTWKRVLITQLLPAQWTNSPLSYFTKQHHDRRGNVGSCECSEAVKAAVLPLLPRAGRAGLLLTEDVDSGGAVAGARHAAGHAGVIPPVLQPNPLQVQAAVAAHAHVGIGNQLPKERWNLSLGNPPWQCALGDAVWLCLAMSHC